MQNKFPVTLFVVSAVCFGTSAYAASLPKGAVKLASDKRFAATGANGKVTCGRIKSQWVPGKLLSKKGDFLPSSKEIANLKTSLKSLSGSKKAKLQKKITKLNAALKSNKALCAVGPNPPTPTPTPTPELLTEMVRAVTENDINHLYRRAGLGQPPAQALSYVGQGVGQLVDFFMTYVDDPAIETEAQTWLDEDPVTLPNYPTNRPTLTGLNLYALRILGKTSNQFYERLAFLGLHDRIATSSQAVATAPSQGGDSQRSLMLKHLNLIRTMGARDMEYAKLVEEMGEDAVMVRWLTLDQNLNTAPNENYAREVMELFSLDTNDSAGNPNYTNDDIKDVARAFTGWNLLFVNGEWRTIFTPSTYDSADKTIFAGTSYQGVVRNGRDVVQHIFNFHPNAGPSLAKWMAREYLREDAAAGIISELSASLKANNFNMRAAFRKLLTSDEFYKSENQFSIAKQPVERAAQLMRVMDSVGMPYNFRTIRDSLATQGCIVTQPDSVFGCDRLEELPDGQRLLNSVNLVTTLSNNDGGFNTAGWNYTRFFPNAAPTADEMINQFEKLFGIKLSDAQRKPVLDYMNNRLNGTTLVAEPWVSSNAAMVRRKVAGLFRLFASLPQVHDLH